MHNPFFATLYPSQTTIFARFVEQNLQRRNHHPFKYVFSRKKKKEILILVVKLILIKQFSNVSLI